MPVIRAVRINQKKKYNCIYSTHFCIIKQFTPSRNCYQLKLNLNHAFFHNNLANSYENSTLLNNQVHVPNYIFRNLDFFVSLASTEFLKHLPCYSFPLAVNNLPNHLKDIFSKKLVRIICIVHIISSVLYRTIGNYKMSSFYLYIFFSIKL